ncbi:alpha/beta fold hydrolase [Qipengyuania spongiae]|uniref:Alpha/beta fold hydrolase n=1 Tax=Qipengyuania spongiae TaxID=2909673 RepID=A0ABY5T0B7_9SPHN|nr:alpha/beta fold hydrolase [Qipengyuania spongiae]UVI40242.1 alpha/beta fold hydrolase [Qipengyuania spongiae]
MPETTANSITLHYEDHGDPANTPILLVMGLGAQMTLWPIELVEALVERGFRVIRYDNRDIGLSQKMDGAKVPGMVRHMIMRRIGFRPAVPYTLADMAADGIGLLDALDIARAHVVGASMGGMIAQLMAVNHPERLLSLTSIMSTTGNPRLPAAERAAIRALTARPASLEEEALVEHGLRVAGAIGSPGYRPDPERLRARVQENVRRSVYPAGLPRQMAAIIDDGDRRARLAEVKVPTLVLHGEADPLVRPEGGRDTAAAIPGARLKTIPGWGHDLPAELVDELADAIAEHAATAA